MISTSTTVYDIRRFRGRGHSTFLLHLEENFEAQIFIRVRCPSITQLTVFQSTEGNSKHLPPADHSPLQQTTSELW